MATSIAPQLLRKYWLDRKEIALLDLRCESPYADSHPLFALSIPVSEIPHKLPSLVPRLSTPIVIYDNGEGYTHRGRTILLSLGYTSVFILEGGLKGYAAVGEVYRDVNVPSKAFGELVESITHTPSLSAKEVRTILQNKGDGERGVTVLDARRFSEYTTMSIPTGRSCPGGELLYRFFEAVPDPNTTVVVNCAGRTRSILGTQTLVNSGVPNKVVALRNGTIGWTLEGLQVDTERKERVGRPGEEEVERARGYARAWAQEVGVRVIGAEELGAFVKEEGRTLYLLDVRDPEEYAAGHPKGFVNAPGGQLVQATDEWVGVRGARLVLYDTDGVRARMTGSWLLQLGWEVYVLDERATVPDLEISGGVKWEPPSEGAITIDDLRKLPETVVVDLARSPAYGKGHIPGAWFASGPELARDLNTIPGDDPIVLTSPDGSVAAMNVEHARSSVSRRVLYLVGGTAAWAAGYALETEGRWLSEPIDVYKRPYEGTGNAREAMQGYLDWEYGLVAQLANDGVAGFHVVRRQPVPNE